MNIYIYIYIFVSATGKYVLYTHKHKSALPQKVKSTLHTKLPFIHRRNLMHIMGFPNLVILQVNCMDSKLSFLVLLYNV